MFINNFDPVAFSLFSLEFRWYSLSYIFGILAGWFLAKRIFIKDPLLKEKFDDYMVVNMIGGKSWKIDDYFVGFFASINNINFLGYKG